MARPIGVLCLAALFVLASCTSIPSAPVAAPADGLVAWYSFNGDAADVTGASPAGVVHGATLVAARKGGGTGAYAFSGGSATIDFPRVHFTSSNALTVSVWVNAQPSSDLAYFIVCGDFGVFQMGSKMGLAISTPVTNSASADIPSGTWANITGTYDGHVIRVYVNGTLRESKDWPGSIHAVDRPLQLGFFAGTYWSGTLDDLRIYDRALPDDEVRALAAARE